MNREDLEAHWMPFTANRHFKAKPRILARAKGMHFWTDDGRQILDGVAGLWCVNAGHAPPGNHQRGGQIARDSWISLRPSTWVTRRHLNWPMRSRRLHRRAWTMCSS